MSRLDTTVTTTTARLPITMIHRVRAARLVARAGARGEQRPLGAAHLLDRRVDGLGEPGAAPGPHPLRRRRGALLAADRHRVGQARQVLAQEGLEPVQRAPCSAGLSAVSRRRAPSEASTPRAPAR